MLLWQIMYNVTVTSMDYVDRACGEILLFFGSNTIYSKSDRLFDFGF